MAAFLYFGGGNVVSINECYNIHLTVHVITSEKLLTKIFKKIQFKLFIYSVRNINE